MHYSNLTKAAISRNPSPDSAMKIKQDETIYLGLAERISKDLLSDLLPDGRMPRFERILNDMTGKMKEIPAFQDIEPIDDSIECFMVDDIEDLSHSYIIFRRGYRPKR